MILRQETLATASVDHYSENAVAAAMIDALQGLEDGVALFDREGILVSCNDAYRRAYPLTADLLEPGVSIREILTASAKRGGFARSEAELADWVDGRVKRHFHSSGIGEFKLANDRWYRITERVTPAGFILKYLTDITEKKALDQEIAALETRVSDSMDALEEGLALFDAEDRLIAANRRYREVFPLVADLVVPGVQFETLIRAAAARRQNIEAVLDPESWIRGRLDRHRQASGTYEHHFADGRWILVRERRTADGKIIGTYSDITALKQREVALQRALEDLEATHLRLRNVFELSFDWNWTSGPDGKVTCETRSGLYDDEFDPTPFIEEALEHLRAARAEPRRDAEMDPAAPTAEFRNLIFDGKLPNGRAVHLRLSGSRAFDRSGRFAGFRGVAADVTEMVVAQRDAARRAAMLSATIESAAQGIVVFDAGLRLQIANQRAMSMLSLKTLDPFEMPHLNNVIEPAIAERIGAWHAQRETFELAPIERATGGAITEVRANAMPDGGVVLTLTDITERVSTEERHHQAQKMVALGHLVGGVAHEFNNLLTSIGGFSKMALDKAEQAEFVRDCLEEVVLASDRAADLTRQMLAFGRKQPIDPKVIPAAKILLDLNRMLRTMVPESVELSISVAEEEIFIRSDAAQMSQALLNLALNARDAMPEGGSLDLSLTVGTMPSADAGSTSAAETRAAVYRVADTGTGMDEETLAQIFDPFFTTKEQGKGTGLGLSFVHGIVERSGGIIQVESAPGHGAVFLVMLPLVDGSELAEEEACSSVVQTGTETILVVEDESGVRNFIQRVLVNCGYHVLTAGNRDEAVEKFEAADPRPHLLLTDIVLPGPCGPDIAKELSARAPDMSVIFMTGYADRDEPQLGRLKPDDVRIDKPFSPAEISNAIRAALDRAGGSNAGIAASVNEGERRD